MVNRRGTYIRQKVVDAEISFTRYDVTRHVRLLLLLLLLWLQRVQKNMHIVLAMSPAGGKFRQRCRMNPSLINCCAIDWYVEWNKEAMLSVAQVYFRHAHFIVDKDYDLNVSWKNF